MAALLSAQAFCAGVSPANLKCGFASNPLGVDNPNPRLNWQIVATSPGARGQAQTAYQVQAASSASLLANGQPDLWDSGEVISTQQFNIAYAGKALTSTEQVFWQVRVWDTNGQPSPWSPVATWTMGLLNQSDWQGGWLASPASMSSYSLTGCSWIWYPEGNPASSAPVASRYFRKTFSLRTDSAVTNATLLVTADNAYGAYINGTSVGQGQNYLVVVPVTVTAQVQAGANLLAIAATNTGTSPNPAGLLGKLVVNYADGTLTNIQMDATWKASKTLQTGWQTSGFNDSSWSNALLLGSYGISPWGTGETIQLPQSGLPIFRRQFTVNSGLQRAIIYICGLGQYELSANGTKVGNALLAPAWSKYDHTCIYDALDITSCLTNGGNALGVMLGNGMYNVSSTTNYSKFTGSFGPPELMAQVYLFYTNGTSQVIATDSQWLTTPGPVTYSHVYGGEYYDARLLPAGWNQAGANTSGWTAAIVTNGPGGTLRGQSFAAPPIYAAQTLQPIQTNTISSGTIVYDLGQNAALIPSLVTHGQAGAVVQISPAELTNSDGTINRNSVGGGTCYCQYTLAGTGSETWTPKFFYHGCRFLQATLTPAPGSSQLPVIDSISGVVIQSASTNVGDFSCSYDLFNRTRNLIRWAQRNNLISILTDCPTRERLGWLEQYNLHGPSLRYEFDVGQLFSKTMQDMADSQISSGLVPDIAPEFTVFGGGFRDSPEWGSSVIIVPWQHYLFTGDDSLLRNYYTNMTNYFAYLNKQAVGNFLNYPNGLGDWYDIGPNAPGYSQDTPISLTADAYYCQDAQILAQAAAELGYTGDATIYSSLAANIGTAFNNTYYSAANGYYATGSQTAQALPLYLGLVSPANQSSVTAQVVANVNSQGLTSGDIGHRYLLRALADMGRSDVIFNLHGGTNDPGYGYILNQGATALTEAWDANPSDSQDHFMLGHITEWFYHDLAGIQPDPAHPGFQNVVIKPAFLSGISWADASYNSVRGTIVSDWGVTNNVASLNVTIPAGSTGSVYLPLLGNAGTNLLVKENGAAIWQNGGVTGSSTGVSFDSLQGDGSQTCLVWKVASGAYQFTWNVIAAPTGLGAAAGNGQIKLNWNPESGASGYNVKRSTTSGSGYTTLAAGVTGTNYTDTSVSNNATYFYVVSAIVTGVETANSSEVSASPAGYVSNFGFETPSVGGYQYNPSGAGWTFTPSSGVNGSGIAANNSGFTSGNSNAPQGAQVAFLQGISNISQTLLGLVSGATYQVTFSAAQRNNIYGQQAGQTWLLQVDGMTIGNYSPPESAQSYVDYNATFTASSAASHTISFVGTDTAGGDNTVLLDNVRIAPVPSMAQPHLAFAISGGQIQLYWPADHTGWQLQTQSNQLRPGTSNWTTVPGTFYTNLFAIPADLSAGSMFFRLAYP